MGSRTDWEVMQHAAATLDKLSIQSDVHVLSAHRTPDMVARYAESARERGIKVIIAGAGGAAHLPGMVRASTDAVPVIGVPIPTTTLQGMDALLSIVQMPSGIPVHTMAIGEPGAVNAAIAAAEILAVSDDVILQHLREYHKKLREAVEEVNRHIRGRNTGVL
jgi:5-(carboxyamino)imidazole ribonucleotide mutase